MVDPWLLRFNQQKRVEMMEEKAIKLLYGGHVPALPRSARDSKQRTTFMSPVF